MQFELSKVNASLVNFNARAEIHGDEKEPAGDLKIKVSLSNDCLAMFHPTLKAMLYHYDKTADADLVDKAMQQESGYAPHLRFGEIPLIAWKSEMIGVKCIIHTGIVGHIRRPGAPRYAAPLTFFVAWWLDYTDL
mgnify:CR=1 FL=1